MNRIQISENFKLDEFIDPVTYEKFGARSVMFIRKEVILAAQYIRSTTGLSITVNNWANGGAYKESGLRNFNTSTGASYSAHKFGAAADLKIGDLDSFEMAAIIKKNWQELYKIGVRRIENPEATKGKNRSWLHFDSYETQTKELIIVNP